MWPDSPEVIGPNPRDAGVDKPYTRAKCDMISKNIIKVLKDNSTLDDPNNKNNDNYWYFKVYYSPAFENMMYQAKLDSKKYTKWVTNYFSDKAYKPDYISPFNGN